MSKKILKLSILLIITTIFISGCTLPWKKKTTSVNQDQANQNGQAAPSSEIAYSKQLKKFLDQNELKAFLETHNNINNFSSSQLNSSVIKSPFANYRADSRGSSSPDIVKINGDYTYSLVRNELIIIKTTPPGEAKIISRTSFKSRPQNIIVSGTSLIVFGADSEIVSQPLYKKFQRKNSYTFLKVFDVSDPSGPKLVRDLNFEGVYSDARLVGNYVYFLTDTPGKYYNNEPLLPRVIDKGEILSPVCETGNPHCFAPEVYYFDIFYSSFNFKNITAINISDNNEEIYGQVFLLGDSQEAYVSLNNIYITYSNIVDEFSLEQTARREEVFSKLSSEEQDKINKIYAAPDYMLNNDEKNFKSGILIDNYLNILNPDEKNTILLKIEDSLKQKLSQARGIEKTSIYRFLMNNKISYEAIGEVDGQVIDKYSMDENGGDLRIATVLNQNSSVGSSQGGVFFSNIFILDRALKILGSLENLSTNAFVNSARFMGNRVYLSTTESDGPLYIVNLSDQSKPAVLGAVKVPSSYSYLLPFDSNGNKIISLGKETGDYGSATSTVKGLKLSLFDFSDLQKPKELDNYTIGDEFSDSIALSDPTTFSYFNSDKSNLLIVPAVLRENGALSFSGALVFNFFDNRLSLKGKIDHSYGGHFTGIDSVNGIDYYDNTVKRGFYLNNLEDAIITFSNKLLKINKLEDFSSIKDVILTTGPDDYIITQPTENTNPAISNPLSATLPATSTSATSSSSTSQVQP